MSERRKFDRLIDRLHESSLDLIAKSRELLKLPTPDTFLGCKTQEPFPPQEEKDKARRGAAHQDQQSADNTARGDDNAAGRQR
jgi:hypothetical protein